MASGEVHVDDAGTIFRATIKDQEGAIVDVSAVTTKQIIFRKADGTVVAKDATFTTNGQDGQIEYLAEVGLLNVAGRWAYQGYVVAATGSWKSDIHRFVLHANL